MVDTSKGLTSEYLAVDDNVIITGYLNSVKSWSSTTGNINLLDTKANYIYWSNTGVASPSFTTRSLGTKLVLSPQMTTTSTDYAIGVENNGLWYSTATTATIHRF